MSTATAIINEALKELRVYQVDNTPTDTEYADALIRLNAMMESWALDISTLGTTTLTISAPSDWSNPITLGPSGDIAMTRPAAIVSVGYRVTTSQTHEPLDLMPLQKLCELAPRNFSDTAKPVVAHYRPTRPNGSLSLSPTPSTGTLGIQSLTPLYSWATLGTNVTLPTGLFRAIYLNLAVELAGEYQVEAGADLKAEAQQALDAWANTAEQMPS